MRDRLIELMKKTVVGMERGHKVVAETIWLPSVFETMADNLLANGVIVPSCKVGDKVFFIVDMRQHKAFNNFVREDTITKIGVTTKGILHERGIDFADFGKTVFLTREEAEKALAEREGAAK